HAAPGGAAWRSGTGGQPRRGAGAPAGRRRRPEAAGGRAPHTHLPREASVPGRGPATVLRGGHAGRTLAAGVGVALAGLRQDAQGPVGVLHRGARGVPRGGTRRGGGPPGREPLGGQPGHRDRHRGHLAAGDPRRSARGGAGRRGRGPREPRGRPRAGTRPRPSVAPRSGSTAGRRTPGGGPPRGGRPAPAPHGGRAGGPGRRRRTGRTGSPAVGPASTPGWNTGSAPHTSWTSTTSPGPGTPGPGTGSPRRTSPSSRRRSRRPRGHV